MGKQTSLAKSRYGWRWILVVIGVISWVSIGCNPQSLSMMLMPFDDNSVQPECKALISDKEFTLAIVVNFARPEVHPDLQAADAELAEQVAVVFRNRYSESKKKIKIVPYATVRSLQVRQQVSGGTVGPVELGKNLKADFVLDLTINSLSIYEKGHYPPFYRGQADTIVDLYKMDAKDGEHKVWHREVRRLFPESSGPIEASSISPSSFRNVFLAKVANDVSKMFIPYSQDDKHPME